ncbi:MAG: hypothetical protein ACRDJK_09635 [Actinomycetota bacterium]
MATTNHERVGKALGLLSQGLSGEGWLRAVTRLDAQTAPSSKKSRPPIPSSS